MTTSEIQDKVRYMFTSDHRLLNSFMFGWESDVWILTKSGLSVEVEVKVSRSDFFADFKKKEKHKLLSNHKKEFVSVPTNGIRKYYMDGKAFVYCGENCPTKFKSIPDSIPNRFYYACPEGLIKPEEVPPYAGLIYPDKYNSIVKKAPLLHKHKKDWTKILMDKYYWRVANAINESFIYNSDLMHLDNVEEYLKRKISKIQNILK